MVLLQGNHDQAYYCSKFSPIGTQKWNIGKYHDSTICGSVYVLRFARPSVTLTRPEDISHTNVRGIKAAIEVFKFIIIYLGFLKVCDTFMSNY